ncbi:MAG: FliG C-terminal domain-containing protein [bacterium]
MEANLTWNLQNALLIYYPETKFVIKAYVELKKIEPKRVLPKLPDALLSKSLTSLPGLPYVPENLDEKKKVNKDASNLRSYIQNNSYDIRRIWVNVLVDRSLTESDWSFIRRFVSLIANLEPKRGDQVRIEGLDFPEKSDFFAVNKESQEKPTADKTLPVKSAIKESSFDWQPYIFAAGLAVFLLIIFLLGIRTIINHLKQANSNIVTAQPVLPKHESETTKNYDLDITKEDDTAVLMRLKTSTIEAIVGTPAAAAKVFHQWIDRNGESGINDVAIVLTVVSKSLIDLLATYLDAETAGNIQQKMEVLQDTDLKENSARLLKQFDEDIRRLVLEAGKDGDEDDALAFLHQMSDDQLQHLLKPLKVGVMAIVLAQLRPNRAAKLLSKMDTKEKKAVLASMGNIERIPSDVYQHIARQLSARASELEKMRYVRANGVDALVKVLDYLDEETQDETLSYLQTQDVNLAQKVSKRFVTFNQLFEMSNEKIRELALEVDREVLAKSLVSVSDEEVEKIIQALPDKLGELVRASLETHSKLSEDEISHARRALIRSLRTKQLHKVS